jgi:hypothetical protein
MQKCNDNAPLDNAIQIATMLADILERKMRRRRIGCRLKWH